MKKFVVLSISVVFLFCSVQSVNAKPDKAGKGAQKSAKVETKQHKNTASHDSNSSGKGKNHAKQAAQVENKEAKMKETAGKRIADLEKKRDAAKAAGDEKTAQDLQTKIDNINSRLEKKETKLDTKRQKVAGKTDPNSKQ